MNEGFTLGCEILSRVSFKWSLGCELTRASDEENECGRGCGGGGIYFWVRVDVMPLTLESLYKGVRRPEEREEEKKVVGT